MLPNVDAVFMLVRALAHQTSVTDVDPPKWLVRRHGLAPLAARAGLAGYRDDLIQATVAWSLIEADLPPVIHALRAAGVRVATLKGASYARRLYAQPAERPMSDVDLMVRPSDYALAMRVLLQLGFYRGKSAVFHHAAALVRDDSVIDLHQNIIGPGRARVDLATVWARMTPGWPDGAEQLEPVDALTFHLIHLARNRLRLPLINIVDASRMLERTDADEVLERARSWGLHRPVDLALRLCRSILEDRGGPPAGWLGPTRDEVIQLAEPTASRKVIYDLATAGTPLQLAARVTQYGLNKVRSLLRRQ